MNGMPAELKIWTIGHSTRAPSDFLGLLAANGIEAVADVRQYPASRRYPHFNRRALSESLAQAGVEYVWLPELGGRRRARPDSRNTAWRNESFRGYADYMETPEFLAGKYKVRVRRATSETHQFLWFQAQELEPVECPAGWMSPTSYNRYLKTTLAKMR
jgi:hypothetical protein